MSVELIDFFTYFDPDLKHHVEAVEALEAAMPKSLLSDRALWVRLYRQDPKTEPPKLELVQDWPITKAQMGEIMGCSPDSLPDSLMDDYARCCETFKLDRINQAFFLGQCGHESAGLRYPVEIHDGSNYEGRSDLGNVNPGDGIKYAGTGWLQMTGAFNHRAFSDYLTSIGKPDPKVMEIGKVYTSEVYPWLCSGFWWYSNGMVELCKNNPNVDEVGARVNGRYLPNGYEDRRKYTERAFHVLGC